MGKDENGRILINVQHMSKFMRNTLCLDKIYSKDEFDKVAMELVSAETLASQTAKEETLDHASNRLSPYEDDYQRTNLRQRIYNELISLQRPDCDDDISLGNGGALPQGDLQKNKTAFIVIGLPASGKSGIACQIADDFGAIILDSDFAKRKFPEYQALFGASLVHNESSSVVFGGFNGHETEPNVLSYAVSNSMNMVIPKIGDTGPKIYSFAKGLTDKGYQVHLVLVRLDREKATQRAIERYRKTKRYVPISLIYDVYSNNPTITFYDMMMLKRYKKAFESFTMISTDVAFGCDAEVMYASPKSPFRK